MHEYAHNAHTLYLASRRVHCGAGVASRWLLGSVSFVLIAVILSAVGCSSSTVAELTTPVKVPASPNTASGESLPFLMQYNEAAQLAISENKPLLVFFTTDNCVYSARMKAGTFTDQGVRQLATKFVCVAVDAAESRSLCKEYDVSEFPTIQFIDAGGLRLSRLVGQQTPNALLLQMHVVLQTVAGRRQLAAQSEATTRTL